MDVREEAVQKKLELGGFLTTGTKYPLTVSYTHLTLRRIRRCRSRWSPYH